MCFWIFLNHFFCKFIKSIAVINICKRSAGYMLRIDCWEAEKNLKTTYGSECALTSLAVDEPLEYARLYLDGNLQMWVDAEDSLELY